MIIHTTLLIFTFIVMVHAHLSGQSTIVEPINNWPALWQLKYSVPAINETNHLYKSAPIKGVICIWENNMEKSARLPMRFRLGCVEKIDRMEGKRRDWLHP
jgi:hypothetical protein